MKTNIARHTKGLTAITLAPAGENRRLIRRDINSAQGKFEYVEVFGQPSIKFTSAPAMMDRNGGYSIIPISQIESFVYGGDGE